MLQFSDSEDCPDTGPHLSKSVPLLTCVHGEMCVICRQVEEVHE